MRRVGYRCPIRSAQEGTPMKASYLRGAALGALALMLAGGGTALANYKLNFGWSPRPHFPSPLIEPSPKPGTWVFKTKLSPELEVRRYNFEMRVTWDRVDQQEWNFTRILQQMLRLGCDIVEPKMAETLIARLYATRSLVRGPDNILHRLSVYEIGCRRPRHWAASSISRTSRSATSSAPSRFRSVRPRSSNSRAATIRNPSTPTRRRRPRASSAVSSPAAFR